MDLLPFLYGIGTGFPLIVGAVIGIFLHPRQKVVAALLAFASGSLITGLAFELVEPAFQTAGPVLTATSLFVGTGLYVAVKSRISTEGDSGFPLLAAVLLDGFAENITLGAALVGGAVDGPLAILIGVATNNLPEAVGGAERMTESGKSAAWTFSVWTATATGLAASVVAGYILFSEVSTTVLALVRATGGGTVLASVAIEIMPDAYEGGGPVIAFATAAGFLVTFVVA